MILHGKGKMVGANEANYTQTVLNREKNRHLGEKMVASPWSTVNWMGGPYAIRCPGSSPAPEWDPSSPLAITSPSESMIPPLVLLPTRRPGSIRIAFTCQFVRVPQHTSLSFDDRVQGQGG